MAMYRMTVTGEWGMNDGELLLGRVACAFAAEGSVAAMETAHSLLAVLFAAPDAHITRAVADGEAGRDAGGGARG